MAVVKPFRALRYVHSRVPRLNEVLSPPYDSLSTEDQLRLHLRNPLNAVRLELGQDQPEDDVVENRNVRAGDFWRGWRDQGVLRRDSVPGIYLLEQAHPAGVRRGFFAVVKLEDLEAKQILPHQETVHASVEDRLQLLKAAKANISPIMALYEDPHQFLAELFFDLTDEAMPLVDVKDETGADTRLWYVNDPVAIESVQEELAKSPLVIADGHHRYAAALAYRDEMRAQTPGWTGDEAWNYTLMLLLDVEDPGLRLQPQHLLVKPSAKIGKDFLKQLEASFIVGEKPLTGPLPEVSQVEEGLYDLSEAAERRTRIGMLIAGEPHFYILTLHEGVPVPGKHSDAWKRLDLSRLRTLILERMLGMSESDGSRTEKIAKTSDFREVLVGLGSGRYPMAFFLNPTPPEQIWAIAQAGDLLPARTTDFVPKVPAGIVFNSLEGTL
jgi:uncharacterized protein (DUF1015 family)